jgi:hypothetical protein
MIPVANPRFRDALRLGLLALAALAPLSAHAAAPPPANTPEAVTNLIDHRLAEHWRGAGLSPAASADDPTLLRRLTLDLAGRVPTPDELDDWVRDRSRDKYDATVRRLVAGPEFAWHFATVLDELIQGRYADNPAFIDYLRQSVRARKGWDVLFREVMLGPWKDDRVAARLFLERRARDLDVLTVDTTRAFFGVDISCARCHNHPLVKDWKRTHYYGMAAFLVRTTGGRGSVGEKADGEARYAGKDGKERTVGMMFLSGQTLEDPPRPMSSGAAIRFSRREALVRVALQEKRFFARAFVNRVWEYLLGRGLVHPTEQMHSGNRASVPDLLDPLAGDFIASGYDISRLVAGIALSREYRLDSRWPPDSSPPDPGHFAVARLRPLSPRQLARSLVVALGDGSFTPAAAQLAALDKQARELMPALDPRTEDFQSSPREALFVSNALVVRKLVAGKNNLADRLTALGDDHDLVRAAYRAVLGRLPAAEELIDLTDWLRRRGTDRRAACEDLVWALAASAEFRFNH